MIVAAALLLAVSASPATALSPASEMAVFAAVQACLDATATTAVASALDGWVPAPAGSFETDGRALIRDNVLMAVSSGANGACLIVAKAEPGFRTLRLSRLIEQRFGAKRRSDAPPVWRLPDGRLLRLNAGAKGGPTYIQLAVAGAEGN